MGITGRTIVCIGSNWDYDPTSKHHIMKVLARRNDILWVNYHGTRRPQLNRSDIRSGLSALRRIACGLQMVEANFRQITPMVIPGARSRIMQAVHRQLLTQQIRDALATIPGSAERPVQIWSFAPDVPFLAGQFNEECFIYYCVDDHAQFEGINSEMITRAENETIDRADMVITTSDALQHAKRFRRPDCALIRHGVDHARFSAAWRVRQPIPSDLSRVPRPIFGFFGLIQHWVDLPLIAEVARLRPGYSFVLIGECQRDMSQLSSLPNVYLLGRKPNADLPAYCAAFSAGLMPFMQSTLARSINPIKMYEYLASGLPVISTPLPEAERFCGPITICGNAPDFAAGCDMALENDHPARRAEISALVAGESWESKVELLSDLVMKRVKRITKEASMPLLHVAGPRLHDDMTIAGTMPFQRTADSTFAD